MVSETNTAKRVRHLSPGELQSVIESHSALLPDGIKATHPERTFEPNYEDLRREMPERWVAIVPTRVDTTGNVTNGHVLASASSRDSLDAAIARLRASHPRVGITIFFTGPYVFGGNLAIS